MQIHGIPSLQGPQRQLQTTTPIIGAEPGDRLSATVTSSEGNRVTLTFANGESVEAGQQASEQLRLGDTVLLQVQQIGQSSASLQLMEINGQPVRAEVSAVEYALLRMNIAPSGAHVALARALQDASLPLSPDTLTRMGTLLKQFPELPPAQAALFAASNLPISEENVARFQVFASDPVKASAFAAVLDELVQSDPAIARTVFAMQAAQAAPAQASFVVQAHPTAIPATVVPLPEGLSPSLVEHLNVTGEWNTLLESLSSANEGELRNNLFAFFTSLPRSATMADRQLLLNAFEAARNTMPATTATGVVAPDAEVGRPLQAEANIAFLPAEATEQPDTSKLQQVQQATAQPAAVDKSTPEAGHTTASAAPEVEFLPLAKIVKNMFALIERGEPFEQAAALKEATVSLPGKVSALTSALSSANGETSSAKSAADMGGALVTQLTFGNEMGNLLYAQIPFSTTPGNKQSAELYVLKREGREKPVDEENATIALCLETENIGRLETLLRVERNELMLQFRVQGKSVQGYVKDQLSRLRELDFPAQYHLSQANVVLQNEPLTPTNAGKTMQRAFGIKSNGSFDLTI